MSRQKTAENKDLFFFTGEYKLGNHDLMVKNYKEYYSLPDAVDDMKKEALCNGFRIWFDPEEKEIERCLENGYGVMVDHWPVAGRMKAFAGRQGVSLKDYLNQSTEMLLRLIKKYGDRVWWTIVAENDSCFYGLWPKEKFSSRKDAYEYFMRHILVSGKTYGRGWKEPPVFDSEGSEGLPTGFEFIRAHNIDPGKCNIAVQCGLTFDVHYMFEWGAKMVWLERNCHILPSVQIGIAFLRGAARQYDGYWGLDTSSWGTPSSWSVRYDSEGRRFSGDTESLFLREWLVGFLSGANLIHQECTDTSYWYVDKKGKKRLSPLGETAQKFVDFSTKRHPDRGVPYAPVAVMLDYYHGWDPGGGFANDNNLWQGKVPYENGDYMINNFFAQGFPGYQDIFTKFNELWVEKGWKTREEYRELVRKGLDERPYEAGRLAQSRWGDTTDVVLSNCSFNALRRYKGLILMGGVKLTDDLRKTLKQYVAQGGKLFLNISQVEEKDSDWLGIRFSKGEVEYAVSYCEVCGKRFAEPGFRTEKTIAPRKAKVIAKSGTFFKDLDGIAFSNAIGKGEVTIVNAPYLLNPVSHEPVTIGKHLLDHFMAQFALVEVIGEPIQYLVNETDAGLIVSLVNNSKNRWKGRVRILGSKRVKDKKVTELWEDRNVKIDLSGRQMAFPLEIAPFEFKICQIR